MKTIIRLLKQGFFAPGRLDLIERRRTHKKVLERKKDISIGIWNIGYCSLGEESAWIFHGGSRIITATLQEVEKNIEGIINESKKMQPDIMLYQEMPRFSVLTYYKNPFLRIRKQLKEYSSFFAAKIALRSIVIPMSVGTATFAKITTELAQKIDLSDEKTTFFTHKLHHHIVSTQHPIKKSDKKLFVFNVHFPAYDKKAETRKAHIEEILEKATALYNEGHYVICGGDWNLLFTPKESFPYTTPEHRVGHLYPFPEDKIPKQWTWMIDPNKPSLRELDQPYKEGKNFVGVVDGLLTSPNIKAKKIQTVRKDFAYSDHNPIMGIFQLR